MVRQVFAQLQYRQDSQRISMSNIQTCGPSPFSRTAHLVAAASCRCANASPRQNDRVPSTGSVVFKLLTTICIGMTIGAEFATASATDFQTAESAEANAPRPASYQTYVEVIDLRSLPRFAKANVRSCKYSETGYRVTATFADLRKFYDDLLTQQGWSEIVRESMQGAQSETYESHEYQKESSTLALSLSSYGAGEQSDVTVSVKHLGNLSPLDLPIAVDGEFDELFVSAGSAGWTSKLPPSELMNAVLERVRRDGWKTYTRPHTNQALPDPIFVSRSVIKQGVELNLFATVAQGLDGKTMLTCAVSLLENEVPIPPDARELSFQPTPVDASYKSSMSVADLVELIQSEAPLTGWSKIETTSSDTTPNKILFYEDRTGAVVRITLSCSVEKDATEARFESGEVPLLDLLSRRVRTGDDPRISIKGFPWPARTLTHEVMASDRGDDGNPVVEVTNERPVDENLRDYRAYFRSLGWDEMSVAWGSGAEAALRVENRKDEKRIGISVELTYQQVQSQGKTYEGSHAKISGAGLKE